MGRRLGDADDPLLVSVRSGAKFSMPGMMETVLNIGLNDESVAAWPRRAATSGSRWTPTAGCCRCSARPCSASTASCFARRPRRGQGRQGHRPTTSTSTPTTCARWSRPSRPIVDEHDRARRSRRTRASSCDLAVRAVFDSWNTDRAVLYRRQERIPDDLGTAVNVQAMVFGNLGMDSGSGVALHPRPGHRRPGRLRRLPAERPGRGRRRRHPQHRAAGRPRRHRQGVATTSCSASWRTLESHYRDMCDIEFTIERGKLWMLQTRVGKRTAEAAFRIAVAHGRRGPDRHGRGAAAGHRRPAGPADVPALRREAPSARCSPRA